MCVEKKNVICIGGRLGRDRGDIIYICCKKMERKRDNPVVYANRSREIGARESSDRNCAVRARASDALSADPFSCG